MIIVEGMDGTGKSSLVARLCEAFDLPLHTRASDSTKGPTQHLYEWARRDVITWAEQERAIYDRHPLVSEFIYGPITRQRMDRRFLSSEGQFLSRVFRENATVVFCDPGHLIATRNITQQPQMSGVIEHMSRLYWGYQSFFHHFDGHIAEWDYTRDSFDGLCARIKAMEYK
jgi:hypothetical protein